VTTSILRVSDPRRAEPLMPGLLHREGVSRQSAMTMVGLSDSDSESSSGDSGCSSEDEQGSSSASKHSP
jgi:hypothetical protein